MVVAELEENSTDKIAQKYEEKQFDGSKLPPWKKRRYHIVAMMFFSLFCLLSMRMILNVAIVAMTKKVNVTLDNGTSVEEQEFDWDSKQQGLLLSCYFYGYIATQLLSGFLSARFGGHVVLGISVAGNAILTMLIPLASQIHFGMLVTVRILEGFFGGGVFTAIIAILANWAPIHERGFLTTVAVMGFQVGNIAATLLSGIIIVAWGWRILFYIFGSIGCICYICWIFVVKGSPQDDPYVTETEKLYILSIIGDRRVKTISHPWKDILTSPPVWAVIVGHFTAMWGNLTMHTQLPTYLNDILKFNLDTTGILAAIPYIALACLLSVSGYLADWLLVKGYLTIGQVRRYFTSITYFVQMIFMLLVAFTTNPILTIIYIALGVGFDAFAWPGYAINALDLAPSHASVIKGIAITIGGFSGIISPLLAGYIVTDKSREQWQIVFFIAAGVFLFGSVFSFLFVRGNIQPWAKIDNMELENRKRSPKTI